MTSNTQQGQLQAVIRSLETATDFEQALGLILSAAAELTDSQAASILEFDEVTNHLRYLVSSLPHSEQLKNISIPLEVSTASWTFCNNQALIVPDLREDPRYFPATDQITGFNTNSTLTVPLPCLGNILGVLEVVNKTNSAHYTEEDVTILATLAFYSGMLLWNSVLERRIQSTREEVAELDRLKKNFIAITSHELRTPLGLILGHATFLRETQEESNREQVDVIIRNATKLKEIIEELTNIDNYETGLATIRHNAISLKHIIEDVTSSFQDMAKRKDITLDVKLGEKDVFIDADLNKISIVLSNLIRNAITFSNENGKVKVLMETVQEHVNVSVIDNGIGIPAQDLTSIFDRFYQVESHLTRSHNGMGLGLSVARAMIEMHGGRIWVESVEGKGSKFTFTLPIRPESKQDNPPLLFPEMEPKFVIAGRLSREYILPPAGQPVLDAPGGNMLYAGGGLRLWDEEVGLLARVGEDYPHHWLHDFEKRSFDVRGIRLLPESVDLRTFVGYTETFEASHSSPVSQFARRELTFPKSLLGYQPPPDFQEDEREPLPYAPTVGDIPKDYLNTSAVHICPLDFITQGQLFATFKAGSASTITLDPWPGYMLPKFLKDLRALLSGLTAFIPSKEELQALFWGQTNDLWEMVEALGEYAPEFIVVKNGGRGQLLYDVNGQKRWEIPAYDSRMADPTGIGDAFCGGFLAGFRKAYDPLEAVLYGNVSASLKAEGSGAFYPLEVMPGLADARLNALRVAVRRI